MLEYILCAFVVGVVQFVLSKDLYQEEEEEAKVREFNLTIDAYDIYVETRCLLEHSTVFLT